MRNTGKPVVIVHRLNGTPEEVARNRENLRYVVEQICKECSESTPKATIVWPGKQERGGPF